MAALALFPKFIGRSFTAKKSQRWSNIVTESVSGKETAIQQWSRPRWDFELPFEFLGQKQPYANLNQVPLPAALLQSLAGNSYADDLKALAGFYALVGGRAQTWLFDDDTDNWINDQPLGSGNGTNTLFQITRPLGPFNEVIQNVNGTPIQANAWSTPGSYSLNTLVVPSTQGIDQQAGRINAPWQTLGWPNYFKCTTAGPTGNIEPNWRNAPMPGMTVAEYSPGTAVWTNMGVPLLVRIDGVAQAPSSYTVGTTGLITFGSAPASGLVTVTCGFYYQCRFAEDNIDFEEIFAGMWANKTLKFSSIKL